MTLQLENMKCRRHSHCWGLSDIDVSGSASTAAAATSTAAAAAVTAAEASVSFLQPLRSEMSINIPGEGRLAAAGVTNASSTGR